MCDFCGGKTQLSDSRGNCIACGAPKNASSLYNTIFQIEIKRKMYFADRTFDYYSRVTTWFSNCHWEDFGYEIVGRGFFERPFTSGETVEILIDNKKIAREISVSRTLDNQYICTLDYIKLIEDELTEQSRIKIEEDVKRFQEHFTKPTRGEAQVMMEIASKASFWDWLFGKVKWS